MAFLGGVFPLQLSDSLPQLANERRCELAHAVRRGGGCECKICRQGIFLGMEGTNTRDCGPVVHEQHLSLWRGGNEALVASRGSGCLGLGGAHRTSMSLKKNWPAVHAEVEELFTHPPDDVTFQTTETVDLTAGRIETRRHTVCHKVDWMTSDRHYPGEPVFPDLAMIGRIETEVERDGKIEHETRYYLCSIALCALSFARVVRAHWGVENRLHWVLDVIFREDLARFRTGDGPQNMAIIRHTALNLLSRAKPTTSLKNRRKRAGWNVGYLETVIRQTA